jgi:hypothetical protein
VEPVEPVAVNEPCGPRRWTRPRGRWAGAPRGAGGRRRRAVCERIVTIVSEQTGYPPDLLDIDLGIDTVGEAEVFASIRYAHNIERDDAFKLGDYPTPARWRCLRTLIA